MQLIVLGMHRSGTSMVTRLINMMGAYFGPEKASLGYATDNPKGFWERQDVMDLDDRLLAANNCHWDRLGAWQFGKLAPIGAEDQRNLKNLVMDLDGFRPWVVKDPRMCLTLPYWKPALEVPIAIIVHRSPHEIARSLQTRNSFTLDYGIALWEYYAVGLLNASIDMPRIHLSMAEVLADPVVAVERLFMALQRMEVAGLRFPSQREVRAFVDPQLHRSKTSKQEEKEQALSPHQKMIESAMLGLVDQRMPFIVSEKSIALMTGKKAA